MEGQPEEAVEGMRSHYPLVEDVDNCISGERDKKSLFVPYLHLFEGGCEFSKSVCAVSHGMER